MLRLIFVLEFCFIYELLQKMHDRWYKTNKSKENKYF